MTPSRPVIPNVLARALLTALAVVILAFPAAVVAGGFVPELPLVGRFTTFLMTDLPVVALGALVATVLAGLAVWLGGRRFAKGLFAFAGVVLGACAVVWMQLSILAGEHGVTYSLARQMSAAEPPPSPDRRVVFATVDGIDLHADIWLPSSGAPAGGTNGRAAAIFVHGGAFVGGELGSRPGLFEALSESGHAVIDIEYRLSPPPRWHDAPADVLCALAWVAREASSLDIDPARVVLMGESAGGSLVLVAAYAAGTDAIAPSCLGSPLVPAGVVAIAPTADLEGIWLDRTLTYGGRAFPEAYIGGPPAEYPDRYAAASPIGMLRPGLPRTLVVAAGNDHLVRLERVTSVVDQLQAAGVETELIVVPFAEHGFDGPANGFGEQLLESVIPAFLWDG